MELQSRGVRRRGGGGRGMHRMNDAKEEMRYEAYLECTLDACIRS